jgi:hypothetical protein
LQQEVEGQRRALTDMADDLEELTNGLDYWQRMRREFVWVFWTIAGPLLLDSGAIS